MFISTGLLGRIATLVVLILVPGVHNPLLTAQSVPQPAQKPHPYLQNSQPLQVNHSGAQGAVDALATGSAQPLSLASADVDADGIDDILVGYGTPEGGVIALHRGNLDAFAPQSPETFSGMTRGQFPPHFSPK